MSQSMQEPPNDDRFAPQSAYEQRQPYPKQGIDLSALQATNDDFVVPAYLAEFREQTPEINKAVSAIMREMEFVKKRGYNKFYGYGYATADDLREHVAHLLGKHGLSYEQHEVKIIQAGTLISVTYLFRLCHESGEKGPYERRTALARVTSEKGNTADDKAISKANVLALKDWSKARFSIPTGEDTEPAGGDDPDRDEATPVGQQLQNRAQERQAPPKGQGSTVNLRDHVRTMQGGKPAQDGDAARKLQEQLAASKAREAGDKDPAIKAREWLNKVLLQISAEPEKAANVVTPPAVQDNVTRLKASHKPLYDELVQAFATPEIIKHTGSLSSVFPDLHKDITEAHKNGQAG